MDSEINNLANDQLITGLENLFGAERRTSHTILLYLWEIQRRKLYADRGFPNLFAMLIGHFHQPETSANQRLKALALMKDVPQVEDHLKNGEVNLSTLALAQRQILREEKVTGTKVTQEKKIEIVEHISNKTMAQAEVELMRLLPESSTEPRTYERRVSENATRVSLTLPDELKEMLIRLKDIWAPVDPSMDYIDLITRAARIALEKEDPTRRKTKVQCATESAKSNSHPGSSAGSSPKRPTYYSVQTDKILWERAGSRCEYVDQQTGRR